MAEVIDFNGEKLISATAISGIKKILTSSDPSIDSLVTIDDSGVYYVQNRSDTPTTYGMLIVMSASTGTSGYQMYLSSTMRLFIRYATNSAWGNWYEIISANTDFGVSGHLVKTATTSDNKSVVNFGTNTLFPASSLYGSVKGRITSGDLNDYLGTEKAGVYYLNAAESAFTNVPVGSSGYGYLFVYCDSTGICLQMFCKSTGLWYRTYSSSSWNPWFKAMYGPASLNLPAVREHGSGTWGKMIDLGDKVFLHSQAIGGMKGSLSGDDDIDDLRYVHQNGAYYCSNTSRTPATYGILVVYGAGASGVTAHQIFYSTSGYVFKRYCSSSTWATWYRIQGFPYGGENGINYSTPKTYLVQIAQGATKTIRFGSGYGEIISSSAYADLRGTYVYYAASSGSVNFSAQSAASSLVLTNTGNGLSIKNNSSTNTTAYITVLIFSGAINEVV